MSEYSSDISHDKASICSEQEIKEVEKTQAKRKLYKMVFSDPCAYLGIITSVIGGSTSILNYLILGFILNVLREYSLGTNKNPMHKIGILLAILAGISVVTGICKGLSAMFWFSSSSHISTKIRNEVFSNIMKYDTTFFDKHGIGELLTILGEDATIIKNAFGPQKGSQFEEGGEFMIGTILIFIYNWKLGLITLALLPVMFLVILPFNSVMVKQNDNRFDNTAKSMTIAEEAITSIRTVRSFNREEEEIKRYNDKTETAGYFAACGSNYTTLMQVIISTITWTTAIGEMYYGATLVDNSEGSRFKSGQLFSCFAYITYGAFNLILCIGNINTEQKAINAAARIFKLISYVPSVNFDGGSTYEPFVGEIKFENVSFKYPTRSVMVLKNVSFEVKPGQSIALVGHSGSGKSTCVQLIQRYYDTTEGRILIDGHDIKDLDPHWLHRKMALVSQEPVLFHGTIKKNVLYGVEKDKAEEEI